jgi:hypothetical protein
VTSPRAGRGVPIEEAPRWALAIVWVLLSGIAFVALVGLSAGLGFGARWPALLGGAAAIALLVLVGLRRQRRWRRDAPEDRRPLFVRFSTWLWTAVLFPNVLHGALVLTDPERPPSYAASLVIGASLSALQGVLSLMARRKRTPAG